MNKEQKEKVLERIREGKEVRTANAQIEVHRRPETAPMEVEMHILAAEMARFIQGAIVEGRAPVTMEELPPINLHEGLRHRMKLTLISGDLLNDIVKELEHRPLSARLREELDD